jgi:hypothetical protein
MCGIYKLIPHWQNPEFFFITQYSRAVPFSGLVYLTQKTGTAHYFKQAALKSYLALPATTSVFCNRPSSEYIFVFMSTSILLV